MARGIFSDLDIADYLKTAEAIEGLLQEAETSKDPQHIAKVKRIAEQARRRIGVQQQNNASCSENGRKQ